MQKTKLTQKFPVLQYLIQYVSKIPRDVRYIVVMLSNLNMLNLCPEYEENSKAMTRHIYMTSIVGCQSELQCIMGYLEVENVIH